MDLEEWRAVVGYAGLYEVSNLGRVRSLDRLVPHSIPGCLRKRKGKVLAGYRKDQYYIRVILHDGTHGTTRTIHSIVADAFLGPRPDGLNVLHNNGDPIDNRPENLRYGTQSENILDCVKHGNHTVASRTHCVRGHEYTPENTKYRKGGSRVCVTCAREDGHNTYMRNREARLAKDRAKREAKRAKVLV